MRVLTNKIEAFLLASAEPLSKQKLMDLCGCDEKQLQQSIEQLAKDYEHKWFEVSESKSGFRICSKQVFATELEKLYPESQKKLSRSLLEILVIILYKQPITRADIEAVRGVGVSSVVMRQLLDLEWVKIAGYKQSPGKPALFKTTKQLLDDLNIKSLQDIPDFKTNQQSIKAIENTKTAE